MEYGIQVIRSNRRSLCIQINGRGDVIVRAPYRLSEREIKRFVEEKHRHGYARLFYVWGHSFEFDRNDNWDVIEKFAQYISGHDHIWYATNIEIYDYVSAYSRLQVSADEKIVHNPSAIDVWVNLDDQTYCIKAGQTINTKAL